MSPMLLISILLLIIGAVGATVYIITSQIKNLQTQLATKEQDTILLEWLKDMKGSVERNSETIEKQLGQQRKSLEDQLTSQREVMSIQTKLIWERLENSSRVIQE
ncbi:hypothetical protein KAZ57_01450, partial [Patescibacteria group bacterium]|nr:hypothetical protein [Patescibacteria group bacterium]